MPDMKTYDDNPEMGLDIQNLGTVTAELIQRLISAALKQSFTEDPPQFELDYWHDAIRLCVKIPLPDDPSGEWPAWYIGLEDLVRGTMEQDRDNMRDPGLVASAVNLANEFRRMADLIESALPET